MKEPGILIINASQAYLDSMTTGLREKFGERILINGYTDPEKGLASLKKSLNGGRIDYFAAIFDYDFPDLTGISLLKKIYAQKPFIKTILITDKADLTDLSQIINRSSIDYFFTKSCDRQEILSAVEECLDSYLLGLKDQKSVEKENSRSEEIKYRRFIRSINDIVYEMDINKKFVMLEGDLTKLGYHDVDPAGIYLPEIIHPDDISIFIKNYNLNSFFKPTVCEIRIKNAKGGYRWVRISSNPLITEKGKFGGTFGAVQIIHHSKMAELALKESREMLKDANRRLNFAFEASNEGYWDIDINTGKAFFSPHYFTMLGYEPGDFEPSPEKTLSLVHNEDRKELEGKRAAFMNGKEKKFEAIFRMKTKNGEWRWIMEKAIIIEKDRDSTPRRIIGTHIDITDLVNAKRAAEEATRLKSAFLANMSHEIRTPLNSIIGFSKLLTKSDISEDKKSRFFEIIRQNTEQLLTLINDILDISRIQSGQLELEPRRVNIDAILSEIYDFYTLIRYRREKNHIEIKYDKNPFQSDLVMTVDPVRLRQVLINLLDNAMKFTEKGGINFGFTAENNDTIRFYVSDTGIGIPSEIKESIFERFRQADNTMKRHFGGTGLGLAICKSLVELMGGTIDVKSEKRRGSEFFFLLPANGDSSVN